MPTTFNTTNVTSDEALLSSDPFTPYAGNVDPRLDFTVGRRSVPYHDWGTEPGRDWVRDVTYGGPYTPKKNTYFKSEDGSTGGKVGWGFSSNALNYTIMRYADVLLMAAEAEIEVGSLPVALGYINLVRARAGANAPSNTAPYFVAANDPSVTWGTYKVASYGAFADQAAARTAVRFERKLELGMEGHRFFDLVRWGIAGAELNPYLTVEGVRRASALASTAFTVGKHEYFAVPAAAIAQSYKDGVPTLTQNPGY
jgi:starch-binding outer membrane protein, SusD/RagB family